MNDFPISPADEQLAIMADARGHETIGFQVTINDEGVAFSMIVKGHSIPISNSDAHAMTMASIYKQFGNGFNGPTTAH